MAEAADDSDDGAGKPSRLPLILGLVLGFVGAGGGFFVMSGMLGGGEETPKVDAADGIAFVPITQMTIPIGAGGAARYLRFSAQLEVEVGSAPDVEQQMPRVVDVLNTYLRSVTLAELEDPASLLTLRAQMRRRIDLVIGGDRVRDLLVMEFVVS